MDLRSLQNLLTQNKLGQITVVNIPGDSNHYVTIPGIGSQPAISYAVDQATLNSLDPTQLRTSNDSNITLYGTLQNGRPADAGSYKLDSIANRANDFLTQQSQKPTYTNENVVGPDVPGLGGIPQDSQSLGYDTGDQISRDAQGNFFLNGQHLSLDQFKQLGINADFVQPGQTVSMSQATMGHEGGLSPVVKQVLLGMDAQGLGLNPNVPITPQSAQEFLTFASQNIGAFLGQAKKEIAPYYQTQLKLAADSLGKNLGFNEDQLALNEKNIQQKYSDTLKNIGESAADRGFAQSGIRNLDESNLARDTQQNIDQGRRTLAYNEGNTVGNFAQRFGSSNLPTVGSSVAPRVIAGQDQFDLSGPASPFYQLSPDVYNGLTGSEQFAETSAENQRASQLEGLYNQQNTLSRTLPA